MQTELLRLRTANIGQTCAGFRLVKKEYVPSKHADLYILRHEKTQAELQEKEYTATAGGGVVAATVDGKHTLKALSIDPEAVDPDDVEMLQDMVIAAVNEAVRAAMDDMSTSMSKITSGMNLPF